MICARCARDIYGAYQDAEIWEAVCSDVLPRESNMSESSTLYSHNKNVDRLTTSYNIVCSKALEANTFLVLAVCGV